ncbi:MAG: diaminopimelate epimerase [Bacteroidales bacterium]|jgi:diaminopimelate epimerase|nr:diaminopimelate epimerase [Bacteroidales bacterium]
MQIDFYKYQGTGNDFILIDNRKANINLYENIINKLCDRRFGIGADGLMILEDDQEVDFVMHYYNSDGKIGSMCGNGGRSIVAFARDLGIITSETTFRATDGLHSAKIDGNIVELNMQNVENIKTIGEKYFMDTGSPHHIQFVTDVKNFDVYKTGKDIRNSSEYNPNGTNVNFVEYNGDNIFVRTYERGVEDETYSCGTGVVASSIAAYINFNRQSSTIDIKTLGGNLSVSFNHTNGIFKDIKLKGPAEHVFNGHININPD